MYIHVRKLCTMPLKIIVSCSLVFQNYYSSFKSTYKLFIFQQLENTWKFREKFAKQYPFILFFCTSTAIVWISDPTIYLLDYCNHLLINLCLRSLTPKVHFPYQDLSITQAEFCSWFFIGAEWSTNFVVCLCIIRHVVI